MSVNPISMKDIDEKEQEFRINCQNDHESTNPREKLLIILAFIFLVLVLSLLSAIVISIAVESLFPKSGICETKHCVMRAGDIIENLNEGIRPCDDFYSYSCGGWKNKNLMSLPSRSTLSEIQYDIFRIMYNIIKKVDENSSNIQGKVAKITKSCIQHQKIANTATLKDSYTNILKKFGGFPLINIKEPTMSTGEKIANLYRLFGMQPILQIEVSPNENNNGENVLVIAPPSKALFEDIENVITFTEDFIKEVFEMSSKLDFSEIKALNDKIKEKIPETLENEETLFLSNERDKYPNWFENKFENFLSTLLGVNLAVATQATADEVGGPEPEAELEPEAEPEKIPPSGQSQQTEQPTQQTSSQSDERLRKQKRERETALNTKSTKLAKLTARSRRDTSNSDERNDVVKILIKNSNIVEDILTVLDTENEETISNFLAVQFLKRIENIIYTPGETIKKSISKDFEDETIIRCLLSLSEYLNYAFGYMYKSHVHIPVEEAQHVVESISETMKSFIPNYSWLDEPTKVLVGNKLNEMQYFIGYPSWLNENSVTDYYNDLTLDTGDRRISRLVRSGKRNFDTKGVQNDGNTDEDEGNTGEDEGNTGEDEGNTGEDEGNTDKDEETSTNVTPSDEANDEENQEGDSNSSAKTFIDMYAEMVEFNMKKIIKKLFETNDRSRWPDIPGLSIIGVNAYYSFELNAIVLPAAILNPPIFDINVPYYLNFGSLGTVIGHEITHGFDLYGRKRNKHGNTPSHETWSENSISLYTELTDCFIRQYSNYSITESTKVNGNTTLAENIADNGAINEALEGYRYWLRKHRGDEKEKSLVALDKFTQEQLFFISYAQSWCHTASKTYVEEQETDEHTINEFRVIGSLSNSEEFSKAFHCTNSDKMNPSPKCKAW